MKIKELYIKNYGTLTDKRIHFSNSVNIIEGKNESGKSTLAFFILFMLYGGSDDIDRIKTSNLPCGGRMTIITERHGEVIIERYANLSGRKYTDTLDVFSVSSMKKLDIKRSVGEELLGINKDFFISSAFITQNGASSYNAKSVNDSVQNILLSASESYNTEKAQKKLDEIRKHFALKRGRGGEIPDCEDRISALNAQMNANKEKHSLIIKKQNETSLQREEKEKYEKLILEISEEKKARYAQKIFESKIRLEKNKNIILSKQKEFDSLNEDCLLFEKKNVRKSLLELNTKINYQKAQISVEKEKLRSLDLSIYNFNHSLYTQEKQNELQNSLLYSKNNQKKLKFISFFAFTIAALTLITSLVLATFQNILLCTFGFAIALTFFCIGFFLLSKKYKAEQKKNQLLSEYGYKSDILIHEIIADFSEKKKILSDEENRKRIKSETTERISELEKRNEEDNRQLSLLLCEILHREIDFPNDTDIEEADAVITGSLIKLEALKKDILHLEEDNKLITAFLDSNHESENNLKLNQSFASYSDTTLDSISRKASDEIKDINEKILSLEKEISVLSASTKPTEVYEEQIQEEEEKLLKKKEQYEIVMLASEALSYASDNIRSAVTPGLLSQTDCLFAALSKGKYTHVGISDELSPEGLEGESVLPKSRLSYGTNEAMYIAFRTSLLLVLCKNELPPILLDESFAHIDNERTLECIKLLSASSIQSLIFTCNDREAGLIKEVMKNFTHVVL